MGISAFRGNKIIAIILRNFHITHLIEKIKSKGQKVGVYPVSEKAWVDVGQWNEFNKVNKLL